MYSKAEGELQQNNRTHPSRWRRPVVALTMTALLSAPGGKFEDTSNQEPTKISASVQAADFGGATTAAPGEKTCKNLSSGDPRIQQDIKANCRSAQIDGQIILVDFTNDTKRSEIAAQAAEKLLQYQTKILSPDIYVIPPSDKAKKALATSVKKSGDCLDGWAAKIAEAEMPEIKTFDFVVAKSPYPPCENKGGIAEYRGRYADIFSKSPHDVSTVAHEVGHLFGLGHADNILRKDSMYDSFSSVNLDPEEKFLSLTNFFKRKGYKYQEYGDSQNIMGNHPHRVGYENRVIPNPFQQDLLRSYSGQQQRGELITNKPLTITPQAANKGAYGIWELNPPIKITLMKDFNKRGVKRKEKQELYFEKLALVPTYENKIVPTYTAYLANTESGIVADIATFYRGLNPKQDNSYSFLSYGKKMLQIRMDRHGMTACSSTFPTSARGLECRAS